MNNGRGYRLSSEGERLVYCSTADDEYQHRNRGVAVFEENGRRIRWTESTIGYPDTDYRSSLPLPYYRGSDFYDASLGRGPALVTFRSICVHSFTKVREKVLDIFHFCSVKFCKILRSTNCQVE